MSWIAVAGVAVTAVGSAVSASGAAKNAKATAKAYGQNAEAEAAFADRQQASLDALTKSKQQKLSNLGNIFDRMESTGAFGDTNTLKNLRKAQADYSALAAGDFSGFESQLRQSLSDSLIATAGSGAPIGTFAGLAAQDQMNLRGQGIQTATGLTEFLSNESYKLLGNEFGIMDKSFETGYNIDRGRVTGLGQAALGQAGTVGVAQTAYGNAGQQIGSSIIGAYNNYQNRQTIQQSNANQLEIARMAYGNKGKTPGSTINPTTGLPTYFDNIGSNLNTGGSNRDWRNGPTGGASSGDMPAFIPLPSEAVTSGADPYGNGNTTLPTKNWQNPYAVNTNALPVTPQTFNDAYRTWGNAGSASSILSDIGSSWRY